MGNFMVQDVLATALGLVLAPLFLAIPGYVCGWWLDVLAFRRRQLGTRILIGVALSFALTPIFTYLVARLLSFTWVWLAYGAIWLAFLVLIARTDLRAQLRQALAQATGDRWTAACLVMAAAWVVVGMLSLVDVQAGQKLYFSVVTYDYTVRVPVTGAITRTGVPPANPSFYPGQPVALYYYYFWFLICSTIDRVSGGTIGSRAALFAGGIWAGLALMALVALYMRFMAAGGRARIALGIGLLLVSGLDIVPALGETLLIRARTGQAYWFPTVEWWNVTGQVTAWCGAVLWTPHHVAGLVAGLTGVLLFRRAADAGSTRQQLPLAVLSGCAFASTVGLSTWIAFVLAVTLAAWGLVALAKGWRHEVVYLLVAGAVALLLAWPLLADLRGADQARQAPFALAVRSFRPAEMILALYYGVRSPAWHQVVNALTLPLQYLVELGFVGVAGTIYWARRRREGRGPDNDELFLLVAVAVSLAIATFVKSNLIENNDLGWRAIMVAQFVLLLWSVDVAAGLVKATHAPVTRAVLLAMLLLGGATSLYELFMLRAYPILTDAGGLPPSGFLNLGEGHGARTYAMRQAYRHVDARLAGGAIVQHNPADYMDVYHALYGNRQVVASDRMHKGLFGVPDASYEPVAAEVARVFTPAGSAQPAMVDDVCRKYGIQALMVKSTDPVWRGPPAWMGRRPPLASNDYAQVIPCGRG